MSEHTRATMQAAIQAGYDEGRGDRIYHTANDARCLELMQQIADEAAEAEIESECVCKNVDGVIWCRLREHGQYPQDAARRALEYLSLRNLIEYDSTGRLVRFVEDGK